MVVVVVVVEPPEVDDPLVVIVVPETDPATCTGTCCPCPVYANACAFGTGTTGPGAVETDDTVGAIDLFDATEDEPAKKGSEKVERPPPVAVDVEPVVDGAPVPVTRWSCVSW